MPERRLAAPRALLHPLGGQLDLLLDTEGGAQQDRFVGGSQRIAVAAGGGARRRSVVLGAPVRRIEHGADGVTVHADGVERARAARDRRDPAHARRPDRLRPAAARLPRPAHAADADGRVHQVHGDLRRAVLARRRPVGQRRRATPGPLTIDLRQLAARRLARRAARLPRGALGARAGPRRPTTSAAPRCSTTSRACSARARRSPERYVERNWAEEEWSRGCYVGYTPPGVLTAYGPGAARADRPAPLGRAPRRATVWNGYMDGAIQSGERAAREAMAALAARDARRRFDSLSWSARRLDSRRGIALGGADARRRWPARRGIQHSSGTRRSRSSAAAGAGAARRSSRPRSAAPFGSSSASIFASENGWIASRGWPSTSAGVWNVLRSSRGGAVRPKKRPWSSDGGRARVQAHPVEEDVRVVAENPRHAPHRGAPAAA